MDMDDGREHMWGYGHGHFWGHGHEHFWGYGHAGLMTMPVMMLGDLLFIAFFIGLAWFLIHWLTTRSLASESYRPYRSPIQLSALESRRQENARGEKHVITFEEVQERQEQSSRQRRRKRTDLVKDEQIMEWME